MPSHPAENRLPEWREPTQARSRARVQAILDAAAAIAVEAGALDLKMTDVAARAGVPIGSVYQFFPSRSVLLARLFAREMGPVDDNLRDGLAAAQSVDHLIRGVGGLIRTSLALVKTRPALLVIWSSPAMDPAIQHADLESSKANARAIADRVIALSTDDIDETALYETALLVCHLWGHVIRLCAFVEAENAENTVLEQFIKMIEGRFREILG